MMKHESEQDFWIVIDSLYFKQRTCMFHGFQLHVASANGYIQAVEFLLDHHVRVDVEDDDSWQPVHCAACWGHVSESTYKLISCMVIWVKLHVKDRFWGPLVAGLVCKLISSGNVQVKWLVKGSVQEELPEKISILGMRGAMLSYMEIKWGWVSYGYA